MWHTLLKSACVLVIAVQLSIHSIAAEILSTASQSISFDGEWLLGVDPANEGRTNGWSNQPRPDARHTKVPWIIQDVFPNYHGVVWYWREFKCPQNPDPQGRYLIKFWNVDYLGEVWVNGKYLGKHEGADGPFVLDATEAIQSGGNNQLAVRVLNPTNKPIDGIVLSETPHRNKTCEYSFGSDYNHGGLEDSVDLFIVPAVWISDLRVRPDSGTGEILVQATVNNKLDRPAAVTLSAEVAPAAEGATIEKITISKLLKPGQQVIETRMKVLQPQLWNLDAPYLYRVTTQISRDGAQCFDARSTRCGFRDFRITNGYFYLNNRRLFLRCSHTGNTAPIGIHLPPDPDMFRRDLLNVKAMGFNAIRFIAALPQRQQLDLCDEIGLLVYEEPYSAWVLGNSPHMAERTDRSISDMIARDRNHPSVVIWGILNETGDGPVYQHAVASLPLVRSLDDSRLVLLSSGRFDNYLQTGSASNPGSDQWQTLLGAEGTPRATKPVAFYPSSVGMGDIHIYPHVPHSEADVRLLRTFGEGKKPFFLSEYGIASSVDLLRTARQYEQRGKESSAEAQFYRQALEKFLADWNRWKMEQTFCRPEEFFHACLAKMASLRLLGINAIRANPACNGYSLTGTVDQGYSGEGLATTFREWKPGTAEALRDGLAPLRFCNFAEPHNVYRGSPMRLEVVLANEDVLAPGAYPVRIDIVNEESKVVETKHTKITVPNTNAEVPIPFVLPVFSKIVRAKWPSGKYRLMATFEHGAAASGGVAEFYVTDAAEMPAIESPVVVWGDDHELRTWLESRGTKLQPLAAKPDMRRQLIIVSGTHAKATKQAEYRDLLVRLAHGSPVVFLNAGSLATEGLPLPCRGRIVNLPSSVYHKDEWNKRHPLFAGLPAGGLMDYGFYRDIIPDSGWKADNGAAAAEAIVGAIQAAPGTGYDGGLLLFADRFGAAKYVVNTLRIREKLQKDPAAERLLRNLIRWSASELDQPTTPLTPVIQQKLGELGL